MTTETVTPAGGDTVLELQDLVVDYQLARVDTFRAVKSVSFDLGRREIFGIVGESGSGKSTVGRVLAGFLPATEGMLRIDGVDVDATDKHATSGRRDVQMIFQDSASALNPRMRVAACVAEALAGGGRIRRAHEAEALEYLAKVGLGEEFGQRKPAELSGGQKQRVAIARALAAKPRVLVCDESVAALDVSVRAKVLNLLLRIREEEQIAIIFISHDLAVVSQLVDRVAVMQEGQVVELGPTRDVIDNPQHDYTRKLLSAIPRLERTSVQA